MKCIHVAPLSLALVIAACAIDDPERPYGRDAGRSGAGGEAARQDGAIESGSAGAAGTGVTLDAASEGAIPTESGFPADSSAESTAPSPDGGDGDADARDATTQMDTSSDTALDGGREVGVADASIDRDPEAGVADAGGERDATLCANNAIRFNGSGSYAQFPRPVADDFTIEGWIRTASSLMGAGFHEGLGLFYADTGGSSNDFGISVLNQKLAVGIGNPDTTFQSLQDVATNRWTHVAVTRHRSSGVVQIYIDGTLDRMGTAPNIGPLNAAGTMTIGANTVNGRFYTGDVDELRIWSVVRTSAQIQATLYRRLVGDESGLVGYYRFDEPGVTMVDDLTTGPSSRNASIIGTATFDVSAAPIFCE